MDLHKNEKNEKNENTLYCEICDFKCRYKSDYDRHLLTAKHQKTYTDLQRTYEKTYNNDIQKVSKVYVCDCGMEYIHRQSLNKHKKKCDKKTRKTSVHVSTSPPENIVHNTSETDHIMQCVQTMMTANTQMVTTFLEAQAEHEEVHAAAAVEQNRLLVEAISLNGPQCITNNNNNTTNNTQFNLNVFLNEDCKNAYTLKEVMDSIECTVTDLDRIDTDGYAATITRKILESMQNMSITERPIHCTDSRRNTVCVKDESGWEKNEKAMKLLVNSVFFVGRKMGSIIDDWKVAYPDHFRGTVSRREQYHRLIMDIMKVNDLDTEARIASKVCKGIVLDRKAVKN